MKKIIIAGLGRCGTTLLFDSIRNTNQFVRDISNINTPEFMPFMCIKTHDFPPEKLPENTTVIFMFGHPFDIVVSANDPNKVNVTEHYLNMHANFAEKNMCYKKDVLRLEEQFDKWMQPQTFNLLTVRYETLWDNVNNIQEVIGVKFSLPEYKERQSCSTLSYSAIDSLGRTYGNLLHKINNAANYKQWDVKK